MLENPDDHFALYNIAVFKARWQGLSEARPDMDIARSVLLAVVNAQMCGIVLYRLGGLSALEGKTDQALNYLQQAITLDKEAIEFALHDLAWLELRSYPPFQNLISDNMCEN